MIWKVLLPGLPKIPMNEEFPVEYSHGQLLCWGAHFCTNVCLQDQCLFDSLKYVIADTFTLVEQHDYRVQRCLILKQGNEFFIKAFYEPPALTEEVKEKMEKAAVTCPACWECGNALYGPAQRMGNCHQPWCNVGLVTDIMSD